MGGYSGLVASTYDLLLPGGELGDLDFYRRAIEDDGQPALEVGCGTGRLLLPYLQRGLDVEGVDSSEEMLALCRRKAGERALEVCLYHQPMQGLDLMRRYRTIYVPGGRAIIPLILPWKTDFATDPAPADEWRLRREGTQDDGAIVRCWERATYDFTAQIKAVRLRYEVIRDGRVAASEEHAMRLSWHTQDRSLSCRGPPASTRSGPFEGIASSRPVRTTRPLLFWGPKWPRL